MSQVATGIVAQLRIGVDEVRADARRAAAAAKQELEQGFKSYSPKITLTAELAPDTQAKLNAVLQKMTFSPVNVKVNFIPGNMPGGGGGGFPAGASSPNWSNYFGGIQNQLAAMTPGASPNWPVIFAQAMGQRGPGGGGGGAGRNPFSLRGISGLVGSAAAVYGVNEALKLGTGIADSMYTGNHPEAILAGMDRLGSRHGAYGDSFMSGQAAQLADVQSTKQLNDTVQQIPLVGTMTKFLDSIIGVTHGLDEMEKNVKGITELHQYAQGQRDDNTTAMAALTHDPLAILDAKQDAERETDKSALKTSFVLYHDALRKAKGDNDPNVLQATRAREELEDAQDKSEVRRKLERSQAVAAEAARHGMAGANEALSTALVGVFAAQGAGDPDQAMRRRQSAELDHLAGTYNAKINAGNLSDSEKTDLTDERDEKLKERRAAQALELQRFNEQRAQDADATAAKIESIELASADKIMRARGEAFNAAISESKRATDERVADLEREARVEDTRDKKRAADLRSLAAAARTAGASDVQAMTIEHVRQTEREALQASNDYGTDMMDARGAGRASRNKRLDDDYQKRVRAIQESDVFDKDEQIINATTEWAGKRALNSHTNQLSDRSLAIGTADAAARARGQDHVGELLSMKAEFEDMERDAVGDSRRERAVAANENARIAAFKKSLQPRSSISRGTDEWFNIQNQLTDGFRDADALKLADVMKGNVGAAGRAAMDAAKAGGAVDPSKSITDAAAKLNAAADKINNAGRLYRVGK